MVTILTIESEWSGERVFPLRSIEIGDVDINR